MQLEHTVVPSSAIELRAATIERLHGDIRPNDPVGILLLVGQTMRRSSSCQNRFHAVYLSICRISPTRPAAANAFMLPFLVLLALCNNTPALRLHQPGAPAALFVDMIHILGLTESPMIIK